MAPSIMNLPSILDNITGLFKPKGESFIGIDIGGSSIKIVQARNKGGQAVLETYGEVALGPYAGMDIGRSVKLPSDSLALALKDILKESNVTTKNCGLAVPITSSLITTIKVPSISEKNLEEIVTMEARRYIPVSMQEITLDWQVIPNEREVSTGSESEAAAAEASGSAILAGDDKKSLESKSLNVLIVAVHAEVVERLKEVSGKTGINCRFFELEAFSSIRAVLGRHDKKEAVVDFGAGSTKVYIVENGIIKSSHTISFGSQDVTLAISRSTGVSIAEAERLKLKGGMFDGANGSGLSKLLDGVASYSANEVTKIIRDYESRNEIVIEGVVLTGGGVNVESLPDLFSKKMTMPVRVADPFSNLVTPAFLENLLKKIGPSYSVAIGAVLRTLEEAY